MSHYIDTLNAEMLENFNAVNRKKNPVALQLDKLKSIQLAHILEQYSLFSKNISTFLLKAFYAMSHASWHSLALELIQNIKEELSLSEGDSGANYLPHYVLLRKGFDEAGYQIGDIKPSNSTQNFIKDVLEVMENINPSVIAGGCYALESSAVPELDMTFDFTNTFFKKSDKSTPEKVKTFFSSHIGEIEIEHEARLKEVCMEHIKTKTQIEHFEEGFRYIMKTMDNWWEGLLDESYSVKV